MTTLYASHLKNGMTSLESQLESLNRLVGIPKTPIGPRYIRGHTTKSRASEIESIASPFAADLRGAFDDSDSGSDGSDSGFGNLSQGQLMGQLASAISRASKRYL